MSLIQYKGQKYRFKGFEDIQTKAGETMKVFGFRTCCATCGAPFDFTLVPDGRTPLRRCPEHKKRGVRVGTSDIHPTARAEDGLAEYHAFIAPLVKQGADKAKSAKPL